MPRTLQKIFVIVVNLAKDRWSYLSVMWSCENATENKLNLRSCAIYPNKFIKIFFSTRLNSYIQFAQFKNTYNKKMKECLNGITQEDKY